MNNIMKKSREERGYTQADMARFLKCSENFYNLVENGHRKPSVEKAKIIGEKLGFDWKYIYEEAVK